MMMARHQCKNDKNVFCYICGDYIMKKQRRNITNRIRNSYQAYFGIAVRHQDKSWAPNVCCSLCSVSLWRWTNGKLKSMPFGIPMLWMEPKNHSDDCYFCTVNMFGFNRRRKKYVAFSNCNNLKTKLNFAIMKMPLNLACLKV